MDSICIWVSSVRRTDFHTGEMRYQKYRFQCSYGDPYHYCTYFFMVFLVGAQHGIGSVSAKTWTFLILSGLATGASWLCYYRALQDGLASVVVPIDKLSILVTILFSYLVFHEKLGKKEAGGLVLIVAGTLGMLV